MTVAQATSPERGPRGWARPDRRPGRPASGSSTSPSSCSSQGIRQDVAAGDRRPAGLLQGGDLLPLRQQGRHPDGAASALHEFGREALEPWVRAPRPASWARLLDRLIDQMLEHRSLFIFHERNQAAIEDLHRSDTTPTTMTSRPASARPCPTGHRGEIRVHMACAFGAMIGALESSGDVFGRLPVRSARRHPAWCGRLTVDGAVRELDVPARRVGGGPGFRWWGVCPCRSDRRRRRGRHPAHART